MTYPDIVVPSCRRQSSLAVRFEVSRVNGSILVVPGHKQRRSLHLGRGAADELRVVREVIEEEYGGGNETVDRSARSISRRLQVRVRRGKKIGEGLGAASQMLLRATLISGDC